MSLYTTLSISKQGLYAAQLGLQVTSQNVANVNTEGYKRQKVNQTNMPYGLGVTIKSVDRVLNQLAERRLTQATSASSSQEFVAQTYLELENLFNEVSNRGMDEEFSDFFTAVQDLSSRPAGSAERSTLRGRGESIGYAFESFYTQMKQQRDNQEIEIDNGVAKANHLIRSIAELNRQIALNHENPTGVNELLNNRDEAVRQLAEQLPVQVIEDEKGNYSLFIQSGMPLVSNGDYNQLESRPDPTDEQRRDVIWKSPTGIEMVITDQINSGSMGAAIESRDVLIPKEMAKLDRLAAEFVLHFNEQHRAGTGLDGISGRNFFAEIPVDAQIGKGMEGGATVSSAVVVDESLLTLDNYEIHFTDPANYEVLNTATGAVVTSGGYVSGAPITFDGIQVSITSISGPPQEDDYFKISTVTKAAENVSISADLQASLEAIAAGFTGETGDNENSLLLANMENDNIAMGGTMGFREMYLTMIVELGEAAASSGLEADTKSTLLNQIENMVESTSGVSIDEETTSLMAYQRAFQASSKVIQVTDEMMATIIQMVR